MLDYVHACPQARSEVAKTSTTVHRIGMQTRGEWGQHELTDTIFVNVLGLQLLVFVVLNRRQVDLDIGVDDGVFVFRILLGQLVAADDLRVTRRYSEKVSQSTFQASSETRMKLKAN